MAVKLTRTQKIIRNLLLIGLCLFLLAWMLEFPCLTKQGLLNRAEREYLLNSPTKLILDREDYMARKFLFGRNKEGILTVNYDITPLGFRYSLWDSQFFPDSDYILLQDMDTHISNGSVRHVYYVVLIGLPEQVSHGELELKNGGSRVLWFEGTLEEPGMMVFPYTGTDAEGNEKVWDTDLKWDEAVLRLYDDAGTLLQEQSFDDLYFGGNGGGRLP